MEDGRSAARSGVWEWTAGTGRYGKRKGTYSKPRYTDPGGGSAGEDGQNRGGGVTGQRFGEALSAGYVGGAILDSPNPSKYRVAAKQPGAGRRVIASDRAV